MRPLILPHGGYGLGNDLIPLGKAYLIAKECNGHLLDISWRDNKRNYKKYFSTTFMDPWFRRLLWKSLPRVAFPVRHSGSNITQDIKDFCIANNLYKSKKPCLVTVTGIDGGPETVHAAKAYLLKRLLDTKYTLDNLSLVNSLLKPDRITVGLHIRLGDFWEIGLRSYAGIVNTRLPMQWYINTAKNLIRGIGRDNIQFILASDEPFSKELLEVQDLTSCSVISRIQNSDVSDLISLSQSDLIICSSSTYSMWAAFLGSAYYLWYKPNLVKIEAGYCLRLAQTSKRLADEAITDFDGTTSGSSDFNAETGHEVDLYSSCYRGHPVDDTGLIPSALMQSLKVRIHEKRPSKDLVRGGVIPLG